jgi:hypothetical protein
MTGRNSREKPPSANYRLHLARQVQSFFRALLIFATRECADFATRIQS